MTQLALVIDLNVCVGCHACATSCKQWNDSGSAGPLAGGDMAAAQVPMTLHMIAIGRRYGSHQVSPWCRIFRHPHMPTTFRFQKEDGSPLSEGWKTTWFADSTRSSAVEWVNQMEKDQVRLIHHIDVKEPAAEHIKAFRPPAITPVDPFSIMMERPACDVPYPCAFQPVCFGKENPDMEAFGLYRKMEQI